jgi:hypothetical protein
MSKKIIPATFHRNEYEKAVFNEAIIYTLDIPIAAVTKITNSAITTFGIAAAPAGTTYSETSTRYAFDTLEGNLPWSSYSKFASTQPRATSGPGLPLASLPSAGSFTLSETIGGTPRTEVVYYGSITWLSATTGIFNNVKRAGSYGGTSYVFTAAATGTFTNVIPVREKLTIWNQTGGILYIGGTAAIATTPVNAVELGQEEQWSVWLEPLQDLYIRPAVAGSVNIAEYR